MYNAGITDITMSKFTIPRKLWDSGALKLSIVNPGIVNRSILIKQNINTTNSIRNMTNIIWVYTIHSFARFVEE